MDGARLLVFALAGLVVLAIAVMAGVLYWSKYKIYRFSAEPARAEAFEGVERVVFQASDGTELRAFAVPGLPDAPVLISFYGNFTGLMPSFRRLQPIIDQGIGVVMLEYRGSGDAPGIPSEANFTADAMALYDHLDTLIGRSTSPEQRFVHGYSLGVSPATALAAQRPVGGLIIEAGYDSLCRFQQKRLRGFPMCRLMWAERHDVIAHAPDLSAPILLAHGQKDRDIPVVWANLLYDALPEPKRQMIYPDGTHTNLMTQGLAEDIVTFIVGPDT
ncbi:MULTISPECIES: alpha/beta hydrolase [unclassified Ruegeria]|uniref:alpha/beta hydrolase n=1 Tax=unclassified Ruegeria TaxID=2625375 RepID=UPI001488BDAB|nr:MULTISPECIES: alpha/beta hydrolase [unclassified Ruegeria]